MNRKFSDKVISALKAAYYPAMALIVSLVLVSIIIRLMGNSPSMDGAKYSRRQFLCYLRL